MRNSAAATALALAILSPLVAPAQDYDLDALRAGVEKYKDVNVALAEGFIADPSGQCISAELEGLPAEMGAMGIHYLRPDLLQLAQGTARVDGTGTNTDFMTPAVLLYEPQADGSLQLVGIENLVFQKAWMDKGSAAPPMTNNVAWDTMSDDPATAGDEAHGFMPHFDLHVWLFRDNPSGMTTPFNPAVSCANASG